MSNHIIYILHDTTCTSLVYLDRRGQGAVKQSPRTHDIAVTLLPWRFHQNAGGFHGIYS